MAFWKAKSYDIPPKTSPKDIDDLRPNLDYLQIGDTIEHKLCYDLNQSVPKGQATHIVIKGLPGGSRSLSVYQFDMYYESQYLGQGAGGKVLILTLLGYDS